jgi:phosphoribosylanthranilate isomerase
MKVKICGVVHPEDARHAAQAGADYIGMLFAKRSRRVVDLNTAQKIADAARQGGADPVGVFEEQSAEQIFSICEQIGIHTVQLHGAPAQQGLEKLLGHYAILYTLADFTQTAPLSVLPLYDPSSGTGKRFDWSAVHPPKNRTWMLAGGLTPDNVADAIALLMPYGVDVASGVEFPKLLRKDPALVDAFIKAAKEYVL